MNDRQLEQILETAKSKSDLHRAIDALPDGAKVILVANACCCGEPEHRPAVGNAIYHAAYGQPSLSEALGLLRMAEHRIIANAFDGGD